ncbi:hypothetical protein Y032_0201g1711 [Ancylostoma ceylanicum]|uniref:SCP domain-containing protein n=1 Tax=Ancylostoma ceylanicum TaxID=53326 RepID=A0A016SM74_9BILA|nr:hypothetical protein Y032_0201g1711 [Ancylostoma ceylanicum]
MTHLYALVILLSAIALLESIQTRPNCSQLGKYALDPDLRERLATEIIANQPIKDVSVPLVYLCALEGMAGLILENSQKPLNCLSDLGIFPLITEMDDEADAGVDALAKAAVGEWALHIPRLTFASSFGCNHVLEDGRHIYLCLFK